MPPVNIQQRLSAAARDDSHHRPLSIDAASADAALRLTELFDRGEVATVTDTILDQIAELCAVRAPAEKDLAPRVSALLSGRDPHVYGVWVHYPWSRRLVHLLPEAEFHEVRTSRNRYKITADEQRRLARATIGIVGLSAGHSIATTLALERTAGAYRLADFDQMSLSNLNRVVAPVGELGINKVVLTARRMFEIDPFLDISIFPEGLAEESFARFLDGGGPLDLLVEECDDLYTKARLRELARSRRIPTLMETNDRGLLDVERFDLEPERPLLHGRIPARGSEALRGLDTKGKVPFALAVGDYERISPRGAATMAEIGRTVVGWSQLGSGTTLGGAVAADAARRILLGDLRRSGRYYVDLSELVSDDVPDRSAPLPEPPSRFAPVPQWSSQALTETLRAILEAGVAAPSGGNCQPWSFRLREDGALDVEHDRTRSHSMLDFEHRAAHLSLGAAVENMVLEAGRLGLAAEVEPFPSPGSPVVARLRFEPKPGVTPDPLASFIHTRATNRRLGPRWPLEDAARGALVDAAEQASATLHVLTDPVALTAIAGVLGAMERVRFLCETLHRELISELRFSKEEADRSGDGLDLATLEMTPSDRAALRVLRQWRVASVLRQIGGGSFLEQSSREAVASASAVCLLTRPGADLPSYFLGGRAVERVWLTATSLGLFLQPMSASIYLFARLEHGGEGFSPEEQAAIGRERRAFLELFPVPAGHGEMLLFRVARTDPPSARSARRPLDLCFRAG